MATTPVYRAPNLVGTPYRPFTGGPAAPTVTPRDPGQFAGHAPTPVSYADFVAPNPADVANDPAYQFRAAEGQRALEHSAAARGMLVGGAALKSLERFRQGLASEEGQKAFERALASYTANRDTNAQNYGQQMGQYQGDLSAFGANAGATNAANAANMSAAYGNYDRGYGAARDAYGDERAAATAGTDLTNANSTIDARNAYELARANAEDYARSVLAASSGGMTSGGGYPSAAESGPYAGYGTSSAAAPSSGVDTSAIPPPWSAPPPTWYAPSTTVTSRVRRDRLGR